VSASPPAAGPALSGGGGLDSFLSNMIPAALKESQAASAARQEARKPVEAKLQSFEDMSDSVMKKIVDQTDQMAKEEKEQLDNPPAQPEDNPTARFGSAASVLAIFGSLLTRAPLTSALNASASAMNAIKKNDWDTYNASYQTWKTQTDNAMKLHQMQMEAYNSALSKIGIDINSARAELTASASAHGDTPLLDVLKVGGPLMVREFLKGQGAAGAAAVKAAWQMDNIHIDQELNRLKNQGNTDPTDPDVKALMDQKQEQQQVGIDNGWESSAGVKAINADQLTAAIHQLGLATANVKQATASGDSSHIATAKLTSDELFSKAAESMGEDLPGLDLMARDVLSTGKLPGIGIMGGTPMKLLIQARAADLAAQQGKSYADIMLGNAEAKSIGMSLDQQTKLAANIEQFEGTARRESALVESLIPKGASASSPILNKWLQFQKGQIQGSPDVSAMDAAITSFKNEYARIMTTAGGGNGGTTSKDARDETERLLNKDMPPDQLYRNITIMRKGMDNRIAAIQVGLNTLRSQFKSITSLDSAEADVQSALNRINTQTADASKSQLALPLPKSKADLANGQTYQTSQGIGTWNASTQQFDLAQ